MAAQTKAQRQEQYRTVLSRGQVCAACTSPKDRAKYAMLLSTVDISEDLLDVVFEMRSAYVETLVRKHTCGDVYPVTVKA